MREELSIRRNFIILVGIDLTFAVISDAIIVAFAAIIALVVAAGFIHVRRDTVEVGIVTVGDV